MGPDTINQAIEAIGAQMAAATGALIPVGQDVCGSIIALSILWLGVVMMTSGSSAMISGIVGTMAAAAGTLWAINNWPEIVLGALHSARAATALVLGGYDGPAGLFALATDVAGRLEYQGVAFEWSSPLASVLAGVTAGLVPVLTWLGFTLTALMACLAEFELVIGGTVAPLILPAIAFGFTRPLGWGVVTWLLSAAVRVVVMGVTSHVLATAMTQVISVGGSDAALDHQQVYVLLTLSLLCALAGLAMNGLSKALVGGGTGALGLGSVASLGGMIQAGARAAGSVAAGGAKAAGSAATSTMRGRSSGMLPPISGGSAFK